MTPVPVLITTAYRGVFFGYSTDEALEEAKTTKILSLRNARNCLYWPPENKGFLGLAEAGPLDGARVGPKADIILMEITCIARCTPAAVDRWEAAPWR